MQVELYTYLYSMDMNKLESSYSITFQKKKSTKKNVMIFYSLLYIAENHKKCKTFSKDQQHLHTRPVRQYKDIRAGTSRFRQQ